MGTQAPQCTRVSRGAMRPAQPPGPRRCAQAPRRETAPSIPSVTDERLFLTPNQDEERTKNPEHQPGWLLENGLNNGVPKPLGGMMLDSRLQPEQGAGADFIPGVG